MELPYTRLCGRFIHFPPYYAVVQVHSQFSSSIRQAQIHRLLIPSQPGHILQNTKYINNVYSKVDAEWLGLLAGVEYAREHGEVTIALEQSNLEIMQGLIVPGTRFYRSSIQDYKDRILSVSPQIDWLGARYISERQNRSIIQRLK